MKTKNKPWLNEKGQPLSTEALKEVSASWDQAIWEKYLQSLEKPFKEKLIAPHYYDELVEEQEETIFQSFCITPDPVSQKLVQDLLSKLSLKQRYVLEQTFFEGRTERQIADDLNVSRSAIYKRKRTALSRIKTLMGQKVATLPLSEGYVTNQKDAFQKIDEFYQDGTLTKEERYRLWALAEVGGLKEGDLS